MYDKPPQCSIKRKWKVNGMYLPTPIEGEAH